MIPQHHPEKANHKSHVNQFMNPTRAPDLLWIWPSSLGESDKSTMEGGVHKPVRGQDVIQPIFGMIQATLMGRFSMGSL